MSDVTQILSAIEQGDPQAAPQLLTLVYNELRSLANQCLARENPGQTLQATALVHEAYLRLLGSAGQPNWDSRGHFFAAAAETMRRILIENARRKKRERHGGGRQRVDLETHLLVVGSEAEELLDVDDALTRLEAEDPAAAAVVKLRFYGGLSTEEAALALGLARATAYRHWTYAKAWLRCALDDGPSPDPVG